MSHVLKPMKLPSRLYFGIWLSVMIAIAAISVTFSSAATLDDFWEGQAHFRQIANLEWSDFPGQSDEQAGWFVVHEGSWYVFNRAYLKNKPEQCPHDYTRIVARESRDKGLLGHLPPS